MAADPAADTSTDLPRRGAVQRLNRALAATAVAATLIVGAAACGDDDVRTPGTEQDDGFGRTDGEGAPGVEGTLDDPTTQEDLDETDVEDRPQGDSP
jgi:hypothetical protein